VPRAPPPPHPALRKKCSLHSFDPRVLDRKFPRTTLVRVSASLAMLAWRDFPTGIRSGNHSDARSPSSSSISAAHPYWQSLPPAPFCATRPMLSSLGNRTRWRTPRLSCAASLAAWRPRGLLCWTALRRKKCGRLPNICESHPQRKCDCRGGTATAMGGVLKVVTSKRRYISGIPGGWLYSLHCNEIARPRVENVGSAAMVACQGETDGKGWGGSEEMA